MPLKWFSEPVPFDPVVADGLVWDLYRTVDCVADTDRWGRQIKQGEVGQRLADIFRAHYTVKNEADLKAHQGLKGAVPDEIALQFFGDQPVLIDPQTPEEMAARDRGVKSIWEFCAPTFTSAASKVLSERDSVVLLEKVISKKRGTSVAVLAKVRFCTQDWHLIKQLAMDKFVTRYESAADGFNSKLLEIQKRIPGLELTVARAGRDALPAIHAKLTAVDVKGIEARLADEALLAGDVEDGDDEEVAS